MKTRILTSLVAICVLIPVLIFSHTVVFPIAIAIASTLCIYEMTNCVGQKKLSVTLPIYAMSVASPFLVRYISMQNVGAIAFICIGVYLLYMFTLIITSHGKLAFSDAISNFAICLYIIIACASINYIRDFGANGKYIYYLIFMGAWVTDTFAYFSGVFFGKHKLIPDVSPKKTIEGSIGGTLFCAISYLVFGLVVGYFDMAVNPNLIFLFIGGIIIAVISQIGDLIMSVIKRHYGIKDYGKIFPGHGGMLDRFDSILAVSLGIAMLLVFSTLIGVNIL